MMRAAPDDELPLFPCARIADEARHTAFFDRSYAEGGDEGMTLFGVSVAETRAFALRALERRMKVIGLLAAA